MNYELKKKRIIIISSVLSFIFYEIISCRSIDRQAYEAKLYVDSIENKEDLINDSNKFVRYFVALDPKTDSKFLLSLSEDEEELVKIGLCRNPNLPKDALINLAKGNSLYIKELLAKKTRDVDILNTLIDSEEEEIKLSALHNSNLKREHQFKLAKDKSEKVREVLARDTKEQEVLASLCTDFSSKVKIAVINNSHTSNNSKRTMAKDESPDVRNALASNKSTPEEVLSELAKDENTSIRISVAKNPNLPSHILTNLSQDPSPDVRWAVLKHNNTSEETIIGILKRYPGYGYQAHVAETTESLAVLEWLVDLGLKRIMEIIISKNKSFSIHREKLLKHKDFAAEWVAEKEREGEINKRKMYEENRKSILEDIRRREAEEFRRRESERYDREQRDERTRNNLNLGR